MKILFFILMALSSIDLLAQERYLFIGTYTGKGSKGIYVYRFDTRKGTATEVSHTENVDNPSYLARSSNGESLYAVNENGGDKPGMVSAFRFDSTTGKLQHINSQESGGDHPCYVSVTKDNRWLVVGNYSGGSLSVFPLGAKGEIGPVRQHIQHKGKGTHTKRQEKAHVHAAVFSPAEDFLFVPDLGTDKVMVYAFRKDSSEPLQPALPAAVPAKPGSGPRHFVFHPNGRYAYLIEELSGTISAYRYRNGRLMPIQRVTTHPARFTGSKGSADIHLSPDGKFLYASNRGDADNLAFYRVDGSTGRLSVIGFKTTGGKTPRNFTIDHTGQYLLVANQNSDNVVIMKRNMSTGLLTETGNQLQVPQPVCLIMD